MSDIGKIVFNPNKNDWTGLGKQIPNDVSEIKQLKTEIAKLITERDVNVNLMAKQVQKIMELGAERDEACEATQHSCQDGHRIIYYSGDDTDCPLCEALNEAKNWKLQADYNDDNIRLYIDRLRALQDAVEKFISEEVPGGVDIWEVDDYIESELSGPLSKSRGDARRLTEEK